MDAVFQDLVIRLRFGGHFIVHAGNHPFGKFIRKRGN